MCKLISKYNPLLKGFEVVEKYAILSHPHTVSKLFSATKFYTLIEKKVIQA